MNPDLVIGVTLGVAAIGVAVKSHREKGARRRAEMKKAAVRWEPAEMKAYDDAILREKLEDEQMMQGRIQANSPLDYFEVGRRLSTGTCFACAEGEHGLPGVRQCLCPCHADEKVPA